MASQALDVCTCDDFSITEFGEKGVFVVGQCQNNHYFLGFDVGDIVLYSPSMGARSS